MLLHRLPMTLSGAVGAILMKHMSLCGGLKTSNLNSTNADCFKYTSDGWKKFATMTKPRVYAASAWVHVF